MPSGSRVFQSPHISALRSVVVTLPPSVIAMPVILESAHSLNAPQPGGRQDRAVAVTW